MSNSIDTIRRQAVELGFVIDEEGSAAELHVMSCEEGFYIGTQDEMEQLIHLWLFDPIAVTSDRANKRALLLRFSESEESFRFRCWQSIQTLSSVALLEHWHVMKAKPPSEKVVGLLEIAANIRFLKVGSNGICCRAECSLVLAFWIHNICIEKTSLPVAIPCSFRATPFDYQNTGHNGHSTDRPPRSVM